MFDDERGVLQGTLELLILKALSCGPAHGYAVARWIEAATDDALSVEEGSLYPALHRMRSKGWIESEWGRSESNRRARFYRLTEKGWSRFRDRSRGWREMVETMERALAAPGSGGAGDGA